MLEQLYPHINWGKLHNVYRFSQQRHLERAISILFPNEHIQINARKEIQLENDLTGRSLELDIWIPSLNLAFEFQVLFYFPFHLFFLIDIFMNNIIIQILSI